MNHVWDIEVLMVIHVHKEIVNLVKHISLDIVIGSILMFLLEILRIDLLILTLSVFVFLKREMEDTLSKDIIGQMIKSMIK